MKKPNHSPASFCLNRALMFGAFLLAALAGCATGTSPLNDFAEAAESAYDHAAAKDWKNASAELTDVRAAMEKLARVNPAPAGFAGGITKLSAAIDAKDRLAAMSAANELTRLAAEAGRASAPKLPPEIMLLDYAGREVIIQSGKGDPVQARAAIVLVRSLWDKVRPAVEAKRGGAKTAADFSAAVAALEHNTAAGNIEALAKTLLDRVDDLEEVF